MATNPEIVDLMEKATLGDGRARYALATRYERGIGVDEDGEKAMFQYRMAAEQGVPEAQERLGRCLVFGFHGSSDHTRGLFWLRKAARGGRSSAAITLGIHFAEDGDRRPHPWRARAWYRLAIALGDAAAHYELSTLLFRGPRTPETTGLAMEHLRKGMKAGDPEAAGGLAYYANSGYGSLEDAAEGCRVLLEMHARAKKLGGEWDAKRRKEILIELFTARAAGAFHPPRPPQVAEAEAEMARRRTIAPEDRRYPSVEGIRRLKPKKIHQLRLAALQGSAYACEALAILLGRPVKDGGEDDLDRAIPLARLGLGPGSSPSGGDGLPGGGNAEERRESAGSLCTGAGRGASPLALHYPRGRGSPRPAGRREATRLRRDDPPGRGSCFGRRS
jgi:TPR repeat protein